MANVNNLIAEVPVHNFLAFKVRHVPQVQAIGAEISKTIKTNKIA